MVGKKIKHYEIIELLGEGGMGQVYKARDTKLERLVALKFLNKDLLTQPEARARFINEARTISSLDHPNVATVFEIDEIDGSVFIAMAYYSGQTLSEMVRSGLLEVDKILDFATQAARGLGAAHEAGVIHRDIKPGNIIITENGLLKILDFGLAKAQNMPNLTQEQTVLGTAAYMSPEQIQGEALDQRSDIFSLGAVIYEMTTGERPFAGEYAASLSYTIVHEDPRPAKTCRSDIPERLDKVISKALTKQKEERYQSAAEIVVDLQNAEAPAHRPSLLSLPGQKKAKNIAFAVLLLFVLVLSTLYFTRPWVRGSGLNGINSVAVMPFSLSPGDYEWQWLGEAVTDLVSSQLEQNANIAVLSSQQRLRTMGALGLKNSDLDKPQALRLAAEAHMQSVVIGTVLKRGDSLVASGQLLTVPGGKVLTSLEPMESTFENLYDLADGVAKQVERYIAPAKAKRAATTTGSHPSLDAYRFYIEGKDAAFDLRHTESIEKLSRAIKIDSTLVQAYYWLAWQHSNLGFDDQAKEVLRKGKPHIEGLSEGLRLEYLANEAVYAKRWQEYSKYLERLIALNPTDASTYYRYGRNQFYKFRQMEQGLANMEHALSLNENYAPAINTLAYLYAARGDTAKAMEMAARYVATNPADINPLDTMAEIQVLLGRYDEAAASCERALVMRPDFPYSRIHLARIYLARRNYALAEKNLSEFEMLSPGPYFQSIAKLLKAKLHFMREEMKPALKYIDEAVGIDPTNREAHWLRGLILLWIRHEKGFTAELAALEHVLSMEGGLEGRWYLYHLQGKAALQRDDAQSAIGYFRKALQLWPQERSAFLTSLAEAYRAGNNFKDAIVEYRAALGINPHNGEALLGIAQTYQNAGQQERARAAYQKLLQVWSGAASSQQEIQVVKNKLSSLN